MNKIIVNITLAAFTFALFAVCPSGALAQPDCPLPTAAPDVPVHGPSAVSPVIPVFGGDTTERSLKVDKKVNLSLCVTQGTVKINGWSRGELRVLVRDGSKFGFRVSQKSTTTGDPVWVMVTGIQAKNKYSVPTECISGGLIEIDLPSDAAVNIRGQETTTTIDHVRKVGAKSIGGDITIRNVAEGIVASTYEGDVTVEESKGAMTLESTTGNILVFDVGPSDIGDMFKAKTNSGAISLQGLEHRQIDVNSISGSVVYSGEILSGGTYSLSTSNGSIRVAIPKTSSCRLSATYGYGTFSSEVPFEIQTENISEGEVKNVVGTVGGGGNAMLRLTTNNGSIGIKKL